MNRYINDGSELLFDFLYEGDMYIAVRSGGRCSLLRLCDPPDTCRCTQPDADTLGRILDELERNTPL